MRRIFKTLTIMAIYVMCCKVTLGQIVFNSVNAVEVRSSVRSLSDTAKIVIPRNCKELQSKNSILQYINEGDAVEVQLGYNDELYTVFEGYIDRIGSTEPLEINCEDKMYKLRRINAKSGIFNNMSIKSFLENQFAGTEYNIESQFDGGYKLNKFIVEKDASLYDMVFELKKDPFGVYSYFSGKNTMRVGFAYNVHAGDATKHYCVRAKEGDNSVRENIVSNELEYFNPYVRKIKIKAISNLRNGKKITIVKGDQDGVLRTLNFYDLDEKELSNIADNELKNMKLCGYKGRLTCFGWPSTKAGDKIKIVDGQYPDRDGTYLVDAVTVNFNDNGYRRTIEIGSRI